MQISAGTLAVAINAADVALKTAGTVSQEIINLAEGVRQLAVEAKAWTDEHEFWFQKNLIRLTGAVGAPAPTFRVDPTSGTAEAANPPGAPVAVGTEPTPAPVVVAGTEAPVADNGTAVPQAPPVANEYVANGATPFTTTTAAPVTTTAAPETTAAAPVAEADTAEQARAEAAN